MNDSTLRAPASLLLLLVVCALLVPATATAQAPFYEKHVDLGNVHYPTVLTHNGFIAGSTGLMDTYFWNGTSPQTLPRLGTGPETMQIHGGDGLDFVGLLQPGAPPHRSRLYQGGFNPNTQITVDSSACEEIVPPFPANEWPVYALDLGEGGNIVGYCLNKFGEARAFIQRGQASRQIHGYIPGSPKHSMLKDVSRSGTYAAGWTGTNLAGFAPQPPLTNPLYNQLSKNVPPDMSQTTAIRYAMWGNSVDTLTSSITGLPQGVSVVGTTAEAVNDAGVVAGYASLSNGDEVGVIWLSPTQAHAIPTPSVFSHLHHCRASAINISGYVVGTCFGPDQGGAQNPQGAFFAVHTPGGVQSSDLNTLTFPATSHYFAATGINDYNQISVYAWFPGNNNPFMGTVMLVPQYMRIGSCQTRSQGCINVLRNQCDAYSGSFNPDALCAAGPVLGGRF